MVPFERAPNSELFSVLLCSWIRMDRGWMGVHLLLFESGWRARPRSVRRLIMIVHAHQWRRTCTYSRHHFVITHLFTLEWTVAAAASAAADGDAHTHPCWLHGSRFIVFRQPSILDQIRLFVTTRATSTRSRKATRSDYKWSSICSPRTVGKECPLFKKFPKLDRATLGSFSLSYESNVTKFSDFLDNFNTCPRGLKI